MGVSKNRGGPPKSSILKRVFYYKPSILGYPYFWKHPHDWVGFHPLYYIPQPNRGETITAQLSLRAQNRVSTNTEGDDSIIWI